MEKFIKLCKICEVILDNNRICRRCGEKHGAVARDKLTCRNCYEKYYNTPVYEAMKRRVKIERREKAREGFLKVLGKTEYNLKILPLRERKILIMRFGLRDGMPRTLEMVAKEFKVTNQRISRIEAKMLEKLRAR